MGLFKSANPPAAPGAVPRSLTGQSIRGKISGPIPIPSPVDDEFPMRNPGTGIATPLTEGDMKEQMMHPPQAEQRAGSIVSVPQPQPEVSQAPRADSVIAPTGSAGSGSGSASSPTSATHANANANANTPQSQRRTNASSNLRYSAVSASSEQTGASKDRPQRKKSTLRGALGKLFGRKKKTSSQGSTDSQRVSTYNASNQHKSVSFGTGCSRTITFFLNLETDGGPTGHFRVKPSQGSRTKAIGVLADHRVRQSITVSLHWTPRYHRH